MNRFRGKERRKQRRRNYVAKDLVKRQFRQQVVPMKKFKYDPDADIEE